MDEQRVVPAQTVVVQGDRIVAIEPEQSALIPDDARRIDGRGKFLLPGLADMHGRIPPATESREWVESVLFLFLANGVTTVRATVNDPGQLALRSQAVRGDIFSPTLYLATPSVQDDRTRTPQDAAAQVREARSEGWDFLEILPRLTAADYRAMVREAREVGMRLSGHVPDRVTLAEALKARQSVIYLEEYPLQSSANLGRLRDMAMRTREAGAAVIPNLHTLYIAHNEHLTSTTLNRYPELQFVPPTIVRRWRGLVRSGDPEFAPSGASAYGLQRLLRELHDGGVTILFGTDSPGLFTVPGFSLHREMRLMRQAGLRPYEILRSATINAARYFGDEDRFGTVKVGARADMILLDANPLIDLENLRRLRGVMVRGNWLDKATIDERLHVIAKNYNGK